MERGRCGEAYNIGSGQSTSMRQVLQMLLDLARAHHVEVRQRADLIRPTEQLAVRVDASKLRRETGWQPGYSLQQTLSDTLASLRQ
jgi:GDP-4-dehydro-6-deoxy-D-mannose reductase